MRSNDSSLEGKSVNISPGFLQQFKQEALLASQRLAYSLRILKSLNYAKIVYLLKLS